MPGTRSRPRRLTRRREPQKTRPLLLPRLGAILLAGLLALCLWIAWQGRRGEVVPAQAIVVLGAAQWNGRPSPVLQARLDQAIALYHQGYAPLLVLTGGSLPADAPSEAAVGRQYALAQGVPAQAILVEDRSHTTAENLRGAWELLSGRDVSEILLVSDPFHMARARWIARGLGFVAHPAPTHTSPISRRPLEEAGYVLREALALFAYWFTGR